jgi:hypothetical protein
MLVDLGLLNEQLFISMHFVIFLQNRINEMV